MSFDEVLTVPKDVGKFRIISWLAKKVEVRKNEDNEHQELCSSPQYMLKLQLSERRLTPERI